MCAVKVEVYIIERESIAIAYTAVTQLCEKKHSHIVIFTKVQVLYKFGGIVVGSGNFFFVQQCLYMDIPDSHSVHNYQMITFPRGGHRYTHCTDTCDRDQDVIKGSSSKMVGDQVVKMNFGIQSIIKL